MSNFFISKKRHIYSISSHLKQSQEKKPVYQPYKHLSRTFQNQKQGARFQSDPRRKSKKPMRVVIIVPRIGFLLLFRTMRRIIITHRIVLSTFI